MKVINFNTFYAVLNTETGRFVYKGGLIECYTYVEVCKQFI